MVLIDSDLQDPPEVIPAMVEQWRQGHAIVLGERRSRAETGLRGIALRLFYPVFDTLMDLPGGLTAGNFSLIFHHNESGQMIASAHSKLQVNDFRRIRKRVCYAPPAG